MQKWKVPEDFGHEISVGGATFPVVDDEEHGRVIAIDSEGDYSTLTSFGCSLVEHVVEGDGELDDWLKTGDEQTEEVKDEETTEESDEDKTDDSTDETTDDETSEEETSEDAEDDTTEDEESTEEDDVVDETMTPAQKKAARRAARKNKG